ncbi:hypothetical protein IV203_018772 [Nitzschia inconspicua]|uniref:DUF6824 domain-containing protein n=1 Tax=Nitzschia inconspicua TaxID=303405 RepID=A0A9K3Q8Y4_9STRA|nr:hypothetical protein IV203_018772 [Nitzschia inconspicua]
MRDNADVPASIEESQLIISNALASLSVADRDLLLEDINAIHRPHKIGAQPNREALAEQLQTMDSWLSANKNDAYKEAELLDRDYVQCRGLRFRFLQSSCFGSRVSQDHAVQAARRLNDYLEFKRRLVGSHRLTRKILTPNDLDADDLDCLESGYWQKVGTDVAGRVIVAAFPILLRYRTPDSFLKAMLLFFSSIFAETSLEEQSQHSLVLVYYNTTLTEPDMDRELASTAVRLLQSLPITICAHHIALHPHITNSAVLSELLTIQESALSQDQLQQWRARHVLHTGTSRDEIELKLRRYGIRVNLPCNRDGSEIQTNAHRQWLLSMRGEEQRQRRASPSDSATLAASVSSGFTIESSKSSSTHYSGELPSSFVTSEMLAEGIEKRSTVFDDPSTAMTKPSAKDILHRQLASDAKTPASAMPVPSGFEDMQPLTANKDSTSRKLPTLASVSSIASAEQNRFSTSAASASAVTKRQRMDPAILTEASIILPKNTDILFGRGSGIQNHPGNVQFRELLEQNLGSYSTSDDAAKRRMVISLADHMRRDLGLRFLKQAPDGVSWIPVTEKAVVYQKFYQTFRSLRAAAKKK